MNNFNCSIFSKYTQYIRKGINFMYLIKEKKEEKEIRLCVQI